MLIHNALALTSAILFILAFPRFDWPWLITIAFAPVLFASAREPSWKRRFVFGWLMGAVTVGGVTPWIEHVIEVHGQIPAAGAWPIFFLYAAAKGLYFAVFAALAGPVMRLPWAVPGVAAVWVAVDALVGTIGYTWVTPGNAGADMSIPMRLAPFTGVHGLSFVFLMMSAALAIVFLGQRRRELLWLLATPLALLLPELPAPRPGVESALVVQPALDEDAQYTREQVDQLQRKFVLVSMQGVLQPGRKPALIIWPEAPAPLYFDEDPGLRQQAGSLARITRTPLLMGAVFRASSDAPLNSALMLSALGEPVTRYDKIELVPFGEYVPPLFRFAGKIAREAGNFEPGTRLVVSKVEGSDGEHGISTFICYESAFPKLARGMTKRGAELLVNISNDGYFGRSPSARGQHLLLVRMRAAENGRWILRATNDGITAAIDPAGRVIDRFESFRPVAKRLPFRYERRTTFYTERGEWFVWLCAVVSAVSLGWATRRSSSRPETG